MTGIVAVHCGAGRHSEKLYKEYKKLCNRASEKGVEVLKNGGNAVEAVKAAIVVLENNPLTNAGYGSNLTLDGMVEGDASIMDGKTLAFGSCGAIRKVKNPILLAHDLCVKQYDPLPLGLVQPTFLVGSGGLKHARQAGLQIVNNRKLVSKKAMKQFSRYKKKLDSEHNLLDTVGAVCVDDLGNVAAGCSSGGLLLKRPGRVGQAAIYGCGVWADNFELSNECSVAVCTTGCGEHLVKTQLAKEIANDLRLSNQPVEDLHKSMTDKFLTSRFLKDVQTKMGGALVLHLNKLDGECLVMWGHSTETMCVGYMKAYDSKPKSTISILPKDTTVGQIVNVGGTYFTINNVQQNGVLKINGSC